MNKWLWLMQLEAWLMRSLIVGDMQLAAVTEERNNLREDLRGHRDSKRTVDNSWRAERERADQLEKELQFYQTQSARAMADRDKVLAHSQSSLQY